MIDACTSATSPPNPIGNPLAALSFAPSGWARWCGCSFDILIYSGDADFILNHMGSVNWITAATGLNASVAVPWQKWLGSDGQVAGYYEMCVPAFAPTCARCLWIA